MQKNDFTAELKKITELNDYEVGRWKEFQVQACELKKAFLSYDFCLAVALCHPFVRICLIKKRQEIIAFLPFQFKDSFHARLGIAERVGGEMSDYFGVVAAPNFVIPPEKLADLIKLNMLHYTHLDCTQQRYGLLGESPEQGLLIKIGPSSERYFQELKEKNKKLVGDTARRQRKIEKDVGPLRFCFNAQEGREGLLIDLIQQKRAQYSRTKVADCLAEPWKQSLLRILLSADDRYCRGILSTLYAGDVWVASHFGLQCDNLLHFWFPVYNEKLSKYSPGRLLMNQVITQAPLQQQPIWTIDRGAGITKAKTDFSNAEHLYCRGEIFKPGVATFSYRMFRSLRWRFQNLQKRISR